MSNTKVKLRLLKKTVDESLNKGPIAQLRNEMAASQGVGLNEKGLVPKIHQDRVTNKKTIIGDQPKMTNPMQAKAPLKAIPGGKAPSMKNPKQVAPMKKVEPPKMKNPMQAKAPTSMGEPKMTNPMQAKPPMKKGAALKENAPKERKIKELQEKIDNGTYKPDSSKIAESMIAHDEKPLDKNTPDEGKTYNSMKKSAVHGSYTPKSGESLAGAALRNPPKMTGFKGLEAKRNHTKAIKEMHKQKLQEIKDSPALKLSEGESYKNLKEKEFKKSEDHQPEEDDIFFHPTGPLGAHTSVSAGGKHLGTFKQEEDAHEAAKAWSKKNKFYPNAWNVSDHGNHHLMENFHKSEANPDEKEDAKLGEKIEQEVEQHMLDNKEAEKKEGHEIMQKDECCKKCGEKGHSIEKCLDGKSLKDRKNLEKDESLWDAFKSGIGMGGAAPGSTSGSAPPRPLDADKAKSFASVFNKSEDTAIDGWSYESLKKSEESKSKI